MEKYVVRSLVCFPLAAPTLASALILIISVIIFLSIVRKGSGSVMNCNNVFLNTHSYCVWAYIKLGTSLYTSAYQGPDLVLIVTLFGMLSR
jgi:hypothetical protein